MESSSTVPIPYPVGVWRVLLRAPLLAYRLGLGSLLNAAHLMILTTRGRKSGQPRFTPIEYRRHGSKIYLVSGWGEQPQWYKNLLTDPLATVQLGGQRHSVLADRVTDPAEALRALSLFRRVAPGRYDAVLGRLVESDVNAHTLPELSDQFTVMRLDIIPDEPALPGVVADLIWLWPVVVGAFVLVSLTRSGRSGRGESV
ncbi:MAG: nitroreductase family deazaflavin-dependent oxidoreductase [Anaerolineae bacterium]|nr:nitroreductase family deazaflavin-dependent oxidoreductase [Anaerolineae bacterium]